MSIASATPPPPDVATPPSSVDVVVVGGGPAGLAAALALGRSRRSVLVVDAGEPRNAPAAAMHAFLTRDGTPPAELLAVAREEVARYGVAHRAGRAVAARRDGDRLHVELDDGTWVAARRLVVATGLVDELPDVDGLAERWGRDVLHCPFCHGWEVRDQRIGVLATSPRAVHTVGLFRQLSDRITYLGHTAGSPDAEAAATFAARDVEVVDGEVVAVEVHEDRLTGVRLADGRVVELDALVVGPRMVARSALLEMLGLRAVEHVSGAGQHVPAEPNGRTSVPGVWVAGNVTDPSAQVIAAAAQGNLAGSHLNADLVLEDEALARAAAEARFWDEVYTREGEDQPIWSGAPNGTLVAEVADLAPGRALDVGCGEGADAVWLARRGWEVTAIDPSPVAVDRAAAAAAAAGVDVRFIASGLLELPDGAGSYDLVSMQYGGLRHRADDAGPRALLAAVAPGGTLLVVHHEVLAPEEDGDGHGHGHDDGHGDGHGDGPGAAAAGTGDRARFDPADHVMPDDVVGHLGDDFEVEVHEVRDRPGPLPEDARHVRDVVLRARRRG